MSRIGSPTLRQARHGSTVSPAAKLHMQIMGLRIQYEAYMKQRKWLAARAVQLRLQDLITRQLKRENREDRRA